HADGRALEEERAEREHLRAPPVDAGAALHHLDARLVLLLNLGVHAEARRDGGGALGDREKERALDVRRGRALGAGGPEAAPRVAEAEDLLARPEVAR